MTITSAIPSTFKLDMLSDALTGTLKVALYNSSASLGKSTTAYSATNEITGTGYTAGGAVISIASGYPLSDSDGNAVAYFDTVSWTSATFTAYGAVIYRVSDSVAVAVLSFGGPRSCSNGTFSLTFSQAQPAPIIIT
jgi:hypothetical protein